MFVCLCLDFLVLSLASQQTVEVGRWHANWLSRVTLAPSLVKWSNTGWLWSDTVMSAGVNFSLCKSPSAMAPAPMIVIFIFFL